MSNIHQGLPFPRRAIAAFAVCSGSLMLMIDASIANIVLPTLAKAFGVTGAQAVMVVTAYQLILAMALMPLAALGARIGFSRLYRAGLILHGLAAVLCFFADSLLQLILVRSLQAVGTAAAMSVAFGLIRTIYPLDQLGKGMAINTIANASGTALAPVIGGLILSMASWQWVFAAAIPFSMLALLLSRALPDAEPQKEPFDGRGALLCAVTFGLLISGMELTTHGPSVTLALLVILLGGLIGWLFVRHELQTPNPVLPVDLLKQSALSLALLSNFCSVLASITVLLFLPFLLQESYGFTPLEVGGLLMFYALASVIVSPTAGYLSDKVPVLMLCTTGMIVASSGLFLVANLPPEPERFDIIWRLWVCGVGFGMFFSPNARLIIGSAPHKKAASAGSMVTTSRMLGMATGASLVAGLLALDFGDSMVPVYCAMALAILSGITCGIRWVTGMKAQTL